MRFENEDRQIGSLTSSQEFFHNLSTPMMRAHRSTHDTSLINMIKQDFKRAIINLNVCQKGAYANQKGDFLDFAMLIALYCQELNLIRRIKYSDTKQDRPLT